MGREAVDATRTRVAGMSYRLIAGCLLAASLGLEASEPVKICLGDSNEWPPYTFWERRDGQADRERLSGSATTLVLTALDRLGLAYQVTYWPWARVQQELAGFAERGRCEMTWDASYTRERAAFAHYSEPLYRTRLGLFYSKQRFPRSPGINGAAALSNFRLCGVIGYNYEPYGLVREPTRYASVQQNLDLLQHLRCDFFPSEIEPLYGGIALGAFQGHTDLGFVELPASKAFYLLLSKGSPRGEQLLQALNRELQVLRESGEAEAIFQRFQPVQLKER